VVMKKMADDDNVSKTMKIQGTFRAVDMLLHTKPCWDSVCVKIQYMVAWKNKGAYRVFAQAKTAMRHRQWKQLFENRGVLELKKIPGLFEDWESYKHRMTNHAQQIIVECGPRPMRLARTTELEKAREKIRELEDENRQLRAEISQNSKRKANEICVDEAEKDDSEENSEDDDSNDDSEDHSLEKQELQIDARLMPD